MSDAAWLTIADAAVWAGWSVVVGVGVHLVPGRWFAHDTWLTRPRAFERNGRVYERVHIRRWKDRLPEAGGLFARDPATVRYVRDRSPVGNLYVNRGITGAMVARQPFGGNRLSGTGSKAGGPDYLLHFVEPRAVTENTMRHGLVV